MSMFMQTIGCLNKGGTSHELDEALAQAVQAVKTTGKVAKITFEIVIRPNDRDADTVTVEDSIKVKTANPPRKAALFFTDDGGRLLRDNPKQAKLPFREIEGGAEASTPPAKAVAQ